MLLQTSLPAKAQVGNQSDVTGAIITTSDIAGGTFTPSSRGRGTKAVFARSSVQVAVNRAAANAIAQLKGNSITSLTGAPITPSTQQTLLSVLTSGSGQGNVGISQIANALNSAQGGFTGNQVRQLAASLGGLLANGRVNPAKLAAAVNAYNAVINASSAQFLNNPPPELRAIQSVLSQLVNTALATR